MNDDYGTTSVSGALRIRFFTARNPLTPLLSGETTLNLRKCNFAGLDLPDGFVSSSGMMRDAV